MDPVPLSGQDVAPSVEDYVRIALGPFRDGRSGLRPASPPAVVK